MSPKFRASLYLQNMLKNLLWCIFYLYWVIFTAKNYLTNIPNINGLILMVILRKRSLFLKKKSLGVTMPEVSLWQDHMKNALSWKPNFYNTNTHLVLPLPTIYKQIGLTLKVWVLSWPKRGNFRQI